MSAESLFPDLLRRVKAGDQNAAAEMVRLYEPVIRRIARIRMRDSRLRQRLDSLDICQSVLGSFFLRAAMGQFELGSADDLMKLLATMVRNKVANQVAREQAACRDYRRVGAMPEEAEPATGTPTPSRVLAGQELLDRARALLAEDELRLLEMRQEGKEWLEIAAAVGGNPDALRKQLARAIERVAQQLDLDE